MGTRHCPLWFPSAFSIELANAFEQPVRGRVQVNRQHRYLLTQFLDGNHGCYYTYVQLPLQWELDALSYWTSPFDLGLAPSPTNDSNEPNLAGSDKVDHLGTSDEVVNTATVLAEDEEGIEQSREHVDTWDLLQHQY